MTEQNNQGEQVQGSIAGVPFRLRGPVAILSVVIVLLVCAVAWLVNFTVGRWGEPFDLQKALIQRTETASLEHQSVIKSILDLNTVKREETYILGICLNKETVRQCANMVNRMQMPDSLRKKLTNNGE